MKERLEKLLKWANAEYHAATNKPHKDYYGGYIQAVKDTLSLHSSEVNSA